MAPGTIWGPTCRTGKRASNSNSLSSHSRWGRREASWWVSRVRWWVVDRMWPQDRRRAWVVVQACCRRSSNRRERRIWWTVPRCSLSWRKQVRDGFDYIVCVRGINVEVDTTTNTEVGSSVREWELRSFSAVVLYRRVCRDHVVLSGRCCTKSMFTRGWVLCDVHLICEFKDIFMITATNNWRNFSNDNITVLVFWFFNSWFGGSVCLSQGPVLGAKLANQSAVVANSNNGQQASSRVRAKLRAILQRRGSVIIRFGSVWVCMLVVRSFCAWQCCVCFTGLDALCFLGGGSRFLFLSFQNCAFWLHFFFCYLILFIKF